MVSGETAQIFWERVFPAKLDIYYLMKQAEQKVNGLVAKKDQIFYLHFAFMKLSTFFFFTDNTVSRKKLEGLKLESSQMRR